MNELTRSRTMNERNEKSLTRQSLPIEGDTLLGVLYRFTVSCLYVHIYTVQPGLTELVRYTPNKFLQ